MKKIIFIEFWNCTPHIETALELAKINIDAGNEVEFYFCGHDVLYQEGIAVSPEDCGLFRKLPEVKGISLINSKRLSFYGRVKLPSVEVDKAVSFNEINQLVNYQYKSFRVGLGVLSSLVSNTKNSQPNLNKNNRIIRTMIESSASVYEFTKSLIANRTPDLIYLFNGRFCNHRAVKCAADELGVPIIFHERGGTKYLYYAKPYMTHDAVRFQNDLKDKWIQVKNDPKVHEIGKSFFEMRREGSEQSWYSFTKYQKRDFLPLIKPGKKVVTYFSSSEDEFVAVGDIFKFEYWSNQFEALKDVIEICQEDKNIQLFIRVHPHLKDKSYEDQQRWLSFANCEDVNFISFNSEVDTYALINRSDIVVTCGSTVGIEASYWGKASVLLGPSHYSKLNGTYNPKSYAELKKLLTNDLMPLNKEAAIAFGYYLTTFGTQYLYYAPETLFKGKFMGIDLQEVSTKRLKWLKMKNMFFTFCQIVKSVLHN